MIYITPATPEAQEGPQKELKKAFINLRQQRQRRPAAEEGQRQALRQEAPAAATPSQGCGPQDLGRQAQDRSAQLPPSEAARHSLSVTAFVT